MQKKAIARQLSTLAGMLFREACTGIVHAGAEHAFGPDFGLPAKI
jgi:alcohol dehydrogenase class IV